MHDLEQLEFEGSETAGAVSPPRAPSWRDLPVEAESPLDEIEEMELASDLLEVSDEAGLNRVVAKLLRAGAGRLGSGAVPTPAVKALGGIVKQAIKRALPALASHPAPFRAITGHDLPVRRVAAGAGAMFGLELEGLSPEDKEFEVAKRLARFGATSARGLARIGRRLTPRDAVKRAAISAARAHAPRLLRSATGQPIGSVGYPSAETPFHPGGRCVRCGRNVIIVNCQ